MMKNSIILILSLMISVSLCGQHKQKNNRKKVMNDDKKELDNFASRSFSWLTGISKDNDYVSVGKVAHYFGVISLRLDSEHSLTRGGVGKNMFEVLNSRQQQKLIELLVDLEKDRKEYHKYHSLVNREIEKLIYREPFNEELMSDYAKKILLAEGNIGYTSALVFYDIYKTLSKKQISTLQNLRQKILNKEAVDTKKGGKRYKISHENTKEIWDLSTRLFAWITGTVKDTHFSPTGKTSQHFGFVKVRVGSGHAIRRGGIAKEVLGLYTQEQQYMLKQLVKEQKLYLTRFLAQRFEFTKTLRTILDGEKVDKEIIDAISLKMGVLEGKMTLMQANRYIALRETFTDKQMADLFKMREKYLPKTGISQTAQSTEDLISIGKKAFNVCVMCHSIQPNKKIVGPSLYRIFNKKIASDESFHYSPSLKAKEGNWTEDQLDTFIESPRTFAPGTIMPFDGVSNPETRKALLVYLKSL